MATLHVANQGDARTGLRVIKWNERLPFERSMTETAQRDPGDDERALIKRYLLSLFERRENARHSRTRLGYRVGTVHCLSGSSWRLYRPGTRSKLAADTGLAA